VPGIASAYLAEGLSLAAEALVAFGGGQLEDLKVFPTNPTEKNETIRRRS